MHQTVARARFHKKDIQKTCIFGAADAAGMLFDVVRHSCNVGLQPAVTKRIGTAAPAKHSVMLRRSCKLTCSWRLLNAL